MLTHRDVLAGMTAVGLTLTMVSTASAGGKRDGDSRAGRTHHDENSSRFASAAVCEVRRDGRVQFVNNRSPFSGSSRGAYGHIFFGGGTVVPSANSRSEHGSSSANGGSHGGSPAAPAKPGAPPTRGGGAPSTGAPGTGAPPAPGGTAPGTPTGGGAPADPPVGGTGPDGAGPAGPAAPGGFGPVAVNPEPASLLLIGTGLGSVLLARRRSRKQKG